VWLYFRAVSRAKSVSFLTAGMAVIVDSEKLDRWSVVAGVAARFLASPSIEKG
jgi:hypothetical protein